METLTLMIDTAALIVLLLFSVRNEKRGPDQPEIGPFRIRASVVETAPKTGRRRTPPR